MESGSIMFGDPATQRAFADEYAEFLIEYKELIKVIEAIMLNRVINASMRDDAAAVAHLQDDDPLVLAVEDKYKANLASFILARMAIDEFSEMLVLASNGYGLGSIKILRSMYERVVTCAYVAQNPEVSRALVDSTWTHQWKVWKVVQRIAPSAIDKVDKSRIEDLENKATEAQSRLNESFCPKCKQLVQVHAWTKVPLSTMAEKVGSDLSGLYLLGYQILTALAHTTGQSINSKMEVGVDGEWTYRMDSSSERRHALHVGHNLLLLLLGRQDDHFGYGLRHLLEPRFEAFKKVWAAHYPNN